MKSWIHDRAADAHRYRADLEVGLTAHRSNGDSCTAEAEQLFLNILGDVGYLIARPEPRDRRYRTRADPSAHALRVRTQ